MINQLAERTIARFLGIGSGFVAIVVVTGTVTDPVNVTKLFALGGMAAGAFAVLLAFGLKSLWDTSKALVIASGLLLVAGINAVVNSDGPLIQNIYGVYGRNTALVTYLLLVLIILSAAVLRSQSSFTCNLGTSWCWSNKCSLLPLGNCLRRLHSLEQSIWQYSGNFWKPKLYWCFLGSLRRQSGRLRLQERRTNRIPNCCSFNFLGHCL